VGRATWRVGSCAIHTIDSAPTEARDTLETARRRFGFLPNLLRELAGAPAALKGYVTLSGLLTESSLQPIEQQVVLLAASLENGCSYCVAAHSAGSKASGAGDDLIQAVRNGGPLADQRLEALRALTSAIVTTRGLVSESDIQRFLTAGFAKEQVFDVLLGVAMKTISNYANHIAETPLDPQLQPFGWNPTHR
jgi:uncharacterized peroxidase-related enzyme